MAQGKIMDTVVRLAGQIDPSLKKSIESAQKQFHKMNKTAFAVNASFVAMGAAAIKASFDATKGLYELGKEFDVAYDAIRVGTGATGEQLNALKQDFKDVYSSVPTTMEDASKAVADFNTRLGLNGKELSDLSKQAIAVSGMMKEDLNTTIQASSQAFKQWGIDSKDMGKSMDYIFKVSQSTGIGFNELMNSMKVTGPAMQQLGFSFEQSAAMMGQMEKAGINTNEALKAMKKSVGVFAKEGYNASDGFKVYSEAIKNAKTETEAITLANEIFGMRAGSTMANAIRKGALSIDEFTKSLANSDETIMKALWDTADATEKSQILTQQIQTAVEPLASDVFDLAAELIPMLSNTLVPLIRFLISNMNILIPIIAGVVAGLGSFSIIQSVVTLMNLWKATTIATTLANGGLVAALQAVWVAMASNPIGWIAIAIGALIGVIALLIANWDKVKAAVISFGQATANICQQLWTNVTEVFGKIGSFIKNNFINILLAALGPLGLIIKGIMKISSGVLNIGKGKNKGADIPQLAAGGFTNGLSIAGEAGREAVISFDPAYRSNNISTWLKAGEMLGVGGGSSMNSVSLGGITMNVSFVVKDSESADSILRKLKNAEGELGDMILDVLENRSAGSYGAVGTIY